MENNEKKSFWDSNPYNDKYEETYGVALEGKQKTTSGDAGWFDQ